MKKERPEQAQPAPEPQIPTPETELEAARLELEKATRTLAELEGREQTKNIAVSELRAARQQGVERLAAGDASVDAEVATVEADLARSERELDGLRGLVAKAQAGRETAQAALILATGRAQEAARAAEIERVFALGSARRGDIEVRLVPQIAEGLYIVGECADRLDQLGARDRRLALLQDFDDTLLWVMSNRGGWCEKPINTWRPTIQLRPLSPPGPPNSTQGTEDNTNAIRR